MNFAGTVARGGLRGPDAHFPAVVENQTVGAAVLEDGVVILVLVELHATVEPVEIEPVSKLAILKTLIKINIYLEQSSGCL